MPGATENAEGKRSARVPGHPRLFFTEAERKSLRARRGDPGTAGRIYRNLIRSADWCLTRPARTTWIAPVTPDPIYLNLYDRFYAMMHDMAVMEHLAFAWSYSGDERYLAGAKRWALSAASLWKREADGEPDQGKAYAASRLVKGLAVCYDLLHARLSAAERAALRDTITQIAGKYYAWYLANPTMAGPGQNKHHGSVEAASFGVAALALLGEVPEAADWLALMIRKHTDYLLPRALTKSGTQEETSNYWASTMQYRISFLDALRRVTGRDLFPAFAPYLGGRIALAAVAGPKTPGREEEQQSILFAPSYGQLDYWSPVLLFLAREFRRPIYQHLALWDPDLGAIQKTRYVTPNGEWLLIELGGYQYAWYDPTVPDRVEPGLPLSYLFADVNEAYIRSSFEAGAIVAGLWRGWAVVHAGGRPVLIDEFDSDYAKQKFVADLAVTDRGTTATIRCGGGPTNPFAAQSMEMRRPGSLILRRQTAGQIRWWCHGRPERAGATLIWPDGTRLRIVRGKMTSFAPNGYRSALAVGHGKLRVKDPTPTEYPLVTVQPAAGEILIEISAPAAAERRKGNGT